jgi:membrane protein required for colicin V production
MSVDVVLLLVLALAAFKGFSRGLVMALFSFAALFVGLAAALKLSSVVANYFSAGSDAAGPWWPVLAFLAVFLAAALLVRTAGAVVEKTLKIAQLGWINRIGGFLVYAMLYLLLFSIALFYLGQMGLISPESMAASRSYPYLEPLGPWAIEGIGKVIPAFQDVFRDLKEYFDGIGKKIPQTAA